MSGRRWGCAVRWVSLSLALVAGPCAGDDIDGPRGIYVLGNGGGDLRNVRDLPFVEGFTLRVGWGQLEPDEGAFDFSLVDAAIARLQEIGKKLTLEVSPLRPPAHVMARVEESWYNPKAGSVVPVPWDPVALASWRTFMEALAGHHVPDLSQGGVPVVLAAHPTLETVDASIPGLLEIRELSGMLVALPSYRRERFLDAVATAVHASRDAFPAKFGFLALFRMEDGEPGDPLDGAVLDRLMAEFNVPGRPTLGFFQETLSDAGPRPDGLGLLLAAAAPETYVMFQALTSWTRPFTGHDKVTSGHPAVGIAFAHETYGATYFELYVTDIDNPELTPELEAWAARLRVKEVGEVRRRLWRNGP